MYSDYGIIVNTPGSWSFDKDTARNAIIYDVDNCSSSHAQ